VCRWSILFCKGNSPDSAPSGCVVALCRRIAARSLRGSCGQVAASHPTQSLHNQGIGKQLQHPFRSSRGLGTLSTALLLSLLTGSSCSSRRQVGTQDVSCETYRCKHRLGIHIPASC
jgi:hypothetical protein